MKWNERQWPSSVSDINKFLWMVRIGGSTDRGEHIKETDYFTPQGEFRIDKDGSSTMLNCLMYKMCYYRFGSVYTEQGKVQQIYRSTRNKVNYNRYIGLHGTGKVQQIYTKQGKVQQIYSSTRNKVNYNRYIGLH